MRSDKFSRLYHNVPGLVMILLAVIFLTVGSSEGNFLHTIADESKSPDRNATYAERSTACPGARLRNLSASFSSATWTVKPEKTSQSVQCYFFSCPHGLELLMTWTKYYLDESKLHSISFFDGNTVRPFYVTHGNDGLSALHDSPPAFPLTPSNSVIMVWQPRQPPYRYSYDEFKVSMKCQPSKEYSYEQVAINSGAVNFRPYSTKDMFYLNAGFYTGDKDSLPMPEVLVQGLSHPTEERSVDNKVVNIEYEECWGSMFETWKAVKIMTRICQISYLVIILLVLYRIFLDEQSCVSCLHGLAYMSGPVLHIGVIVCCIVLYMHSWCEVRGEAYALKDSFSFGVTFYLLCGGCLLGLCSHCGRCMRLTDDYYHASNYKAPRPAHTDDELMLALLIAAAAAGAPRLRYNNPQVQTFRPAPIPPPTIYGPRNRKALLVGCTYPGSPSPLPGCIHDIKRIAQRLHTNYQVKMLADDQTDPYLIPTRQGIMNGLAWLVQGMQVNDGTTVFFHFSGHGSQEPDENGDEVDGMDETIVPTDYKTAGMITDDEIQDEFLRKVPVGNRVLSIMDCCHSGTVMDLPYYCVPHKDRKNKEVEMVGDESSKNNRVDCDALMISGCEDAQTSIDCGAIGEAFMELADTNAGGALTAAFLVAVMKNPNHTLNTLLLDIREALAARGFEQVPQISGSKPYDVTTTHFDLFPEQLGNFIEGGGSVRPNQSSPHLGGPNMYQQQQQQQQPPPGYAVPPPGPFGAAPPPVSVTDYKTSGSVANPYASSQPASPQAGAAGFNPYAAAASSSPTSGAGAANPYAAAGSPTRSATANPYGAASPTGSAAANPYANPLQQPQSPGYTPPVLAPPPTKDASVTQYSDKEEKPSFSRPSSAEEPLLTDGPVATL